MCIFAVVFCMVGPLGRVVPPGPTLSLYISSDSCTSIAPATTFAKSSNASVSGFVMKFELFCSSGIEHRVHLLQMSKAGSTSKSGTEKKAGTDKGSVEKKAGTAKGSVEKKASTAAVPVLTVNNFRNACFNLGASFGRAFLSRESIGHCARQWSGSLAGFWTGLDESNQKIALGAEDGLIVSRFVKHLYCHLDFPTLAEIMKGEIMPHGYSCNLEDDIEDIAEDPADDLADEDPADEDSDGANDRERCFEAENVNDASWRRTRGDFVLWGMLLSDVQLGKILAWINQAASK